MREDTDVDVGHTGIGLRSQSHYIDICVQYLRLVAWLSGNIVGRYHEVTLRRARLVLGWVTVFGG